MFILHVNICYHCFWKSPDTKLSVLRMLVNIVVDKVFYASVYWPHRADQERILLFECLNKTNYVALFGILLYRLTVCLSADWPCWEKSEKFLLEAKSFLLLIDHKGVFDVGGHIANWLSADNRSKQMNSSAFTATRLIVLNTMSRNYMINLL